MGTVQPLGNTLYGDVVFRKNLTCVGNELTISWVIHGFHRDNHACEVMVVMLIEVALEMVFAQTSAHQQQVGGTG